MLFVNSVRVAPGVRSALAVAVWGLGCLGVAQAESESEVPDVVTTATRTATRVSSVVADVTVIDQDKLKASVGQSLAQVLAKESGIQFASNGGLGKNSSVFLRGGESKQTLLLVDGVRLGSVTTGAPALSNIPLESIERIEIVRGPLASLYGSDAVAGVIQIFTKRGASGALTPSVSVTMGSNDFHQVSASVSGGSADTRGSLGVSFLEEQGFNATNRLSSSYHPDRDGFRQQAVNASLSQRLVGDWHLRFNGLVSAGRNETDNGVAPAKPWLSEQYDVRSSVLGLGVSGRVLPDWRTEVKLSRSYDSSNQVTGVSLTKAESRFASVQRQITWENQVALPLGSLLAALDHLDQAADLTSPNKVNHRDVNALVLGWSGDAGAHAWQVSGRQEHNSQFGDKTTGTVGYGYEVVPGWRLGGVLGSSFAAPTLSALYSTSGGDPNLMPEEGVNKELSLTRMTEQGRWRLSVYRNDMRNLIQYVKPRYVATGRARTEGVSLAVDESWQTAMGLLSVNTSADWLNAVDMGTGKRLARRANGTLRGDVGLTAGAWRYGVSLNARDGMYNDAEINVAKREFERLGGTTVLGASVRWQVQKDWAVALRLDNLTNRTYFTAYGYNQPGRQAFLTLSYSPK